VTPPAWDGYLLDTAVGNYPLQLRLDNARDPAAWPPTAFSAAAVSDSRFSAFMRTFFADLALEGEVRGDEAEGSWRGLTRSGAGRWKAWRRPAAADGDRGAWPAAADRLLDLMTALYPFWERKGLEPERLRPSCEEAARRAGTRDEFLGDLGALVSTLNDAHTVVVSHPGLQQLVKGRAAGVTVDSVEGRFFITEALPSVGGLGHGSWEILSVDGKAAAARARALLREVPLSSGTHRHLQHLVCVHLLAGPPGSEAALEVRQGHGGTTRVFVPRAGQRLPALEGRLLAGNVGYVRIRRFDDPVGTRVAFDEALLRLRGAGALVLDLRDNGGGTSSAAGAVAGRLLAARQTLAIGAYPRRGGYGPALSFPVSPRGPWQYAGPVAVLTNGGTYSTAEVLTGALRDAGRVVVVGTATGGGASNKIGVCLPGGVWATFSTVDGRRPAGPSLEGVGIAPDVVVAPTADERLAGRDPVLEAALLTLGTRSGTAPASPRPELGVPGGVSDGFR
jgi:carboxyl-terminal processing protease